jgi:hypothetical protein
LGLVLPAAAVLMAAPPAGAAYLQDQDSSAAVRLGDRVGVLDATIRDLQLELPVTEAAAASSEAAAETATILEIKTRTVGMPAIRTTSAGVLETAATAILGDLAPEYASASVIKARQDAQHAVAHRDDVRARLAAAVGERAGSIDALTTTGQRTQWSILLLDRLGAPITGENLRVLAAWIGAEANEVSLRNPLATTMDAPGARSMNSHGVKSYPSDEVGIDASVRTLRLGAYTGVVAALMRGESASQIATAIAASPWGTGQNVILRLALERR